MVLPLGRRGMEGMGALIVFIALLIVAFIVGVAITSTGSNILSNQKAVAKEKEEGMQAPVMIEGVRAYDSNGDKRIDEMIMLIRLRAGDNAMQFNTTTILVDSKAINCSTLTYGLDADPDCSYTVNYAKRGGAYYVDRLSDGDLVQITFSGTNLLKGVEDLTSSISFLPEHGVATQIRFELPARIYPQNVQLWPIGDGS